MTHHTAIALATLALFGASGCATAVEEPRENFEDRADLSVHYVPADVDNGVSSEIEVEIPPGAQSMLIEVRGSTGRYYLSKFVTPAGRDLIEASQFMTRGARELPGLVTWLYPNTPGVQPDPGTYQLIIRSEDGSGGHVEDEDLDVRVYVKQATGLERCGLHLDFLVAEDAIVAEDAEPMVDNIVADLVAQYDTAGVDVLDYTVSSVTLPTADLDLGGNPARVISEVADVMDAARGEGLVRSQTIHILLVRSLGTALRGYAMGLPGPMGSDLPTSAVLVSSRAFVDNLGYLDVEAMAETVAHELGHYLGLYHTSEGDRQFHDPIADTAECTESECPDEFWQNLMSPGTSGRTVLTPGQAEIIHNHPLCIPTQGDGPVEPVTCDLACDQEGYTCALLGGQEMCALACDPNGGGCPDGGGCKADELGKYICTGP